MQNQAKQAMPKVARKRHPAAVATLALLLGCSFASPLMASGLHVISGIDADTPLHAYRPVPARQQMASNLGGGFIQMLMTGDAGSSAPVYAQPQSRRAAPPPRFARQEVSYATQAAPGTLIVDTPHRYLYLVEGHGLAMRFGVGVGRPGFTWSGIVRISRKQKWPTWTPPESMRRRRPNLPAMMPGGESNPLGARALYLGNSEYRIHGTNEPWSIGTNLSSGCIRMMNADVRYLYRKVDVGTQVIVMPG